MLYFLYKANLRRTDLSKEKEKKKARHTAHYRRHNFLYRLLRPLVVVFLKIKFGYKFKKAKKLPKNYIVLSNHTTDFDPVFVAVAFNRPMYFVASEHITRWKTAYKLLDFAFNPIIRYKGTVASSTVMETLRRVRYGENVCLFAEGVRSWNGETGDILPSTAKMIKSAKCGLVTFKLTGGYFVSPNWTTSKVRRGKVRGAVAGIYTAEQIANMTEEEVYKIITTDLYENAYTRQMVELNKYKGKNIAEGLENLIYICPHCREYDTLKSLDDAVTCNKCRHSFKYNIYGVLEGTSHHTIKGLYDAQLERLREDIKKNKAYTAPTATISKIERNHIKETLEAGALTLDTKSLKCGKNEFDTIHIQDMAIYGKHGLVFTYENEYYEIIPDKNYSALKFLLYYKELKKQKKNN